MINEFIWDFWNNNIPFYVSLGKRTTAMVYWRATLDSRIIFFVTSIEKLKGGGEIERIFDIVHGELPVAIRMANDLSDRKL